MYEAQRHHKHTHIWHIKMKSSKNAHESKELVESNSSVLPKLNLEQMTPLYKTLNTF